MISDNVEIDGNILIFYSDFSEPITEYFLEKIEKYECVEIYFSEHMDNNHPYNKNIYSLYNLELPDLPTIIQTITFGTKFNKSVDNLPSKLINLIFNSFSEFSQDVLNLPQELEYLEFGPAFNQSVSNLPNSLTTLIFGNGFNQSVDYLPNSITKLTFGYSFNQSVSNLPNNLNEITFGTMFNRDIANLPNSLNKIIFGVSFNQNVDYLPNSISEITFRDKFNKKIDNLPNGLKKISFEFNSEFNQEMNNLPNSLCDLEFHSNTVFNQQIEKLPDNLINLQLGANFNSPIKHLPPSLKMLKICAGKRNNNSNILPKTLKELEERIEFISKALIRDKSDKSDKTGPVIKSNFIDLSLPDTIEKVLLIVNPHDIIIKYSLEKN
jgi:hypothetical protein